MYLYQFSTDISGYIYWITNVRTRRGVRIQLFLCLWWVHCLSMVSCPKAPTRHAYAWPIGPFGQDTLDITVEIWGVLCQMQASKAGTCNSAPWYMWEVITCPYPRYQLMAEHPWNIACHDDVIKWKHFPRNCPFVRGIHQSPVYSPYKGQWCGALIFSLIYAWINGWVNNHEAGHLRCHRAHYDVIVMLSAISYISCIIHPYIPWIIHNAHNENVHIVLKQSLF